MSDARPSLGHYEILGPIGAGGMGEVFSAHDPILGRRVAIKKLPLRLTGDRDTLSRFTQEARSASALNHPNIVTIYEVGAADGMPYIVMEYIDGHDLRTVMSSGPPPIRKVLELASQIADGLATAHERGIVHRDLKPENIMITRDGFVKILDFGLAKVISPAGEAENTLELDLPGTNPGTILGTVGYMSPEQATGAKLDFRSDQFAFGSILYELLAGTAPFEGPNAIDTLSAVLHHRPAPIASRNPNAPAQLCDIVHRLLEKSRDDRYASTRDLARELRTLRDRVSAEESGFHRSAPAPQQRPRIWPAMIAAAAFALFLAGAIWMARNRTTPQPATGTITAPAPKKYLAVMRFNDLTGDANGQLMVDGFAETLTTRLAHFPALQVMRPRTGATASGDVKTVARELGANLVLTGSMMRSGDRIRVTYSVVEPSTGREQRELVEGSMSDLFGVQDQVATSVAEKLELGQVALRTPLDPTISQRRYLEAIGYLRRYDDEKSIDNALKLLSDLGGSASVQSALGRAYLAKYQLTRNPQWAAKANDACERALKSDPQSPDVHTTLGELRRQTGRYAEAETEFVRVLSQQPNNADAVLGLAETYKAAGDLKRAEASYKQAIELQPNFWGGYNNLGVFYFIQGRYADAVPLFTKVVQLVPDNERGYNNLGGAYEQLGRYDDAIRVFTQSIRRKPSAQGYSNLGTCHYFLGRYPDAAQAYERATSLSPDDYLYWSNLGDAYRWSPGQQANARRAYDRAVDLASAAIRVNPSDASAHICLAVALAKRGDVQRARSVVLRALELEPSNPSFVYQAAVIANVAGSEDEALARLRQALRLGYPAGDVERDPEFANLRKRGTLQGVLKEFRSNSQKT
jgi:serine/threonine-protein kinase